MEKENFKEDVLCCINLRGRFTGSDIFRFLKDYFSEKDRLGKLGRVCIDGVVSMNSYRLGEVPNVKK